MALASMALPIDIPRNDQTKKRPNIVQAAKLMSLDLAPPARAGEAAQPEAGADDHGDEEDGEAGIDEVEPQMQQHGASPPQVEDIVEDAGQRVESVPVGELPGLIDGLAALAGEYFGSIAALSGAGYKLEMNLAQFHRRHLARDPGDSHLPLLAGFEPAAGPERHALASLDWWHAPHETGAPTPADRHARVVEARKAAEAAALAALDSLKTQGLITDQEYQAKRSEILGRI